MQSIGYLRSGISRLVAHSFVLYEVHFLQSIYELITGISILQFLFQISVYNKRYETGNEVGYDSFLPFQIHRTCLEFAFHNPETFFDFPAPLIYFHNRFWRIRQIGTYCIKSIKHFFFGNGFFINIIHRLIRHFTILGGMIRFNETFWIILSFLFDGLTAF